MDDQLRAAERVGDYWDALVLGQEPAAGLEPGLAHAIERIQQLGVAPSTTARERVRQHLASQLAPRQSLQEAPMHPVIAFPGTHSAAVVPQGGRRSAARTLTAIVAAAAVLLALVGLGSGGLRLNPRSPGEPAPAMLAAIQEATPEATAGDETVLVVPLAAEPETFESISNWMIYAITVEPGTRAEWKEKVASNCCPGPRFEYLVSGEMTFRSSQPTQVIRADSNLAVETIAADTEVTLQPGDARISRNEIAFKAVNPGDAPAEMVLSTMMFDSGDVEPVPTGWVTPPGAWESFDLHSGAREMSRASLGGFEMRLRRLDLEPDAVAAPPAAASVQLGVAFDAEAPLGRPGGGALRNMGSQPITVYLLTLEPLGADADSASSPTP